MSTSVLCEVYLLPRQSQRLVELDAASGVALARLSGLEGFSRALVSGVVPVLAFAALGTKQAVSLTFLVGGVFALVMTLSFGSLEQLLQRSWVVTVALSFLVVGAALNLVDGPLFALGIGVRSAAASVFSVALSLLIMDAVRRQDLTRNESRRMIYVGASWLIGPSLGLWLLDRYGRAAAFGLASLAAAAAITYFWRAGIGGNGTRLNTESVNPLRSIPRYFKQPFLRIAYAVTTCRSMYWVALFIYGPIYVSEAGLPVWVTGVMLSVVSGFLWLSPMVRRAADRFGTRSVIMTGFLMLSAGLAGLGLLRDPQPLGVVLWIASAVGASFVDVLGNIPFMRTVRPRERVPMTAVFSTWREMSTLLTPGLAALVLVFAPFWVFYLLLASFAAMTAWAASYLPRRI